jgi:hypothetical protein
MLVRLIPTGQAELLGLAVCLGRLFPGHDFATVPARVDPDGRRVPFDGFTSSRLSSPENVGTRLPRLVAQLAAEVYPGRDGTSADLAVLIDDLELDNADQPQVVVACVREAVHLHIAELAQHRSAETVHRVERALLARASFHLAAPMIEAWFFADPAALVMAGVPAERLPPRLRRDVDVEDFETDDAPFSNDDGTICAALLARNARRPSRKSERAPWALARRPELPGYRRERHPKAYLSWLCRDPSSERCTAYRESDHGRSALEGLPWARVLGSPRHCRFARTLVNDLAEVLGAPAVPLPPGEEHPLLTRSGATAARVLRNV